MIEKTPSTPTFPHRQFSLANIHTIPINNPSDPPTNFHNTKMQASRLITASTRTLSRRQPLSTTTTAPVVPRILDRRENETGPGGRGSDAGLKVAVFGASGFLGRYVCSHLGEFLVGLSVLFLFCGFVVVVVCIDWYDVWNFSHYLEKKRFKFKMLHSIS